MGSDVQNIPGYVARGGDAPILNPHEIIIVGHDIPYVPELWFAYCPRIADEVREVADERAGRFAPPEGTLSLASVREHGIIDPADVYLLKREIRVVDRVLPVRTPICLDGRRRTLRGRIVFDEQAAVKLEDRKGAVRCLLRGGRSEPDLALLYSYNVLGNTGKPLTTPQRAELVRHRFSVIVPDTGAAGASERFAAEQQVAHEFGVHWRTVQSYIALDNAAPEVKRAATEGVEVNGAKRKLPAHVAAEVARLPAPEQPKAIERWKDAGAPKGEKARLAVKAPKDGKARATPMLPRGIVERLYERVDKAYRKGERTPCVATARDLLAFVLGDRETGEAMAGQMGEWVREALERSRREK